MKKKSFIKLVFMGGLLLTAFFLTWYFHGVLKTGKVFTHFFYVPIAFASLWWKKRGVYVALFLSGVLVLSHYIVKDYSVTASDLIRALMFMIISWLIAFLSEELVKQKEAKNYFAEESVTDSLTGLHNYSFYQKNSEWLFNLSVKYDSPFSLAIIDIDNFKVINDTYGHKAGNIVLTNFGKALRGTFRSSDILIRYGGDEFLLLLPGISRKSIVNVMSRLKDNISKEPASFKESIINYNFSWGAAEYSEEMISLDEMFKIADEELYRVKPGHC